MTSYLPPINIAEVFNVSDYDWQYISLTLKDGDQRYLRPMKKLQEKTFGISYNGATETINLSKNINVANLVNTVNGAIRNDLAIGESLAIGSNLLVGKNIINSGDIHTNDIYAKSININNGTFTNILIDDIPINSTSIRYINNLSSDVQLQLDTNAKKQGDKGDIGLTGDRGLTGDAGQKGDIGLTGDEGQMGDIGLTGDKGQMGDIGLTGDAGQKGDIGLTGDRGLTGDAGQKGDIGLTGDAGQKGDIGLTGDAGQKGDRGKNGLNSTLGAYFVNLGVGTFPIYGSMSDFSSFGLSLYIKGERDSFIIMPFFALFAFSEINQAGKFLSMGNLSNNIEYYNISPLFRVKSCTLYKYNQDTQAYEVVNTVNNINTEKTWN